MSNEQRLGIGEDAAGDEAEMKETSGGDRPLREYIESGEGREAAPGGTLPLRGRFDGGDDDDNAVVEEEAEVVEVAETNSSAAGSRPGSRRDRQDDMSGDRVTPVSSQVFSQWRAERGLLRRGALQEVEDEVEDGEINDQPQSQVSPYVECLSQGRWRIAQYVWKHEWDFHRKVISGASAEWLHDGTMQVLLSIENKLLELIVRGNIQKAEKDDVAVRKILRNLTAKASSQSCEYLWEFVDDEKDSPSPEKLRVIIGVARRYAENAEEDWEMVRAVDTWKKTAYKFSTPGMERGKRRYLTGPDPRRKLEELLAKLEEFLAGEPSEEPLYQPLREVGFSSNVVSHISQHERHDGSNYLMNLFEAIAAYLGWNYRNHVSIIYLCWEYPHAAIGEIVMSCLAQSYIHTGRGFNHEPTGGSVHHAYSASFERMNEWRSDAWEVGPFQANRDHEREVVAEANAHKQRLIDGCDRMRANLVGEGAGGDDSQGSRETEAIEDHAVEEPLIALRRKHANGEFETEEEYEAAEDMVREFMTLRVLRRREAAAAQGRMLATLETPAGDQMS